MDIHELRKRIDELIFEVEQIQLSQCFSSEETRCRALVKTKLQEAKMWAGQILGARNSHLPKEHSDFCEQREEGTTNEQVTELEPQTCVSVETKNKPEQS